MLLILLVVIVVIGVLMFNRRKGFASSGEVFLIGRDASRFTFQTFT